MMSSTPELTRHLVKVLLFVFILRHSDVAISQGDLRWAYFCTGTAGNITCPERSTVDLRQMYHGYSAVCLENRTDPLTGADCFLPANSIALLSQRIVCNQTQTCPLSLPPGGHTVACGPSSRANFDAFSYTCQFDPTLPTTEQTTEQTTQPTSQTDITVQTTEGTTAEPTAAPVTADNTLLIIAGSAAGGAILLIVLGILIAVCRSRGRGTESIEHPDNKPPPVSEIKMVTSGTNRVKTAPRIKQDPHRRVDIPLVVYNDSEQPYPNDDPRGLYALPDNTRHRHVGEADDTPNIEDQTASGTADDSFPPLPEDLDIFVDVGGHYAEVDIDNKGRVADDSFASGTGSRGTPDGDSQVREDIAPLRHDQPSNIGEKRDTDSVVYAKVNKNKPHSGDSGSENLKDDSLDPSEPVYSN